MISKPITKFTHEEYPSAALSSAAAVAETAARMSGSVSGIWRTGSMTSLMRVCDENLRMYRESLGDAYPEGDHIDNDVLHHACVELFTPLSTKEDAMEAVERWVDHERWCVRALAQGAKHLLEHGSFNYGPTTGEEYDEDADLDDDDFDEFCSFAGFNVN